MNLFSSVLASENAFGAISSITVPPEYVEPLLAEMTAADRDDLVPLVDEGAPGLMVVVIAGREWRFGGL